jgi:hypothetical protein
VHSAPADTNRAGAHVDPHRRDVDDVIEPRLSAAEHRSNPLDEGEISHYGGVGQRLLGGVSPLSGQFFGFHDPYRDTLRSAA